MSFMVEHPVVFLGLCGVMVCNAIIVWRIAHNYEPPPFGELIPFPQRDEQ